MSIGKAIAIVGGVAVGAIGAYNFSSTGCLLGTSCDTETTANAASVETVAAQGESCALGCSMEKATATMSVAAEAESCCSAEKAVADACCSDDKAAAEVVAVASTEAASCCSAEKAEGAVTMTVAAEEEAECPAQADNCCGQCKDGGECDESVAGTSTCCQTKKADTEG